jgi:hypothetical protein
MSHVCRTCSRVNPADALFCYFDGVALDSHHLGGPVAAGGKLFPTPFVFPSGRQCRNFDELVRVADEDWPAAQEVLRDGFFESFLGSIGRADLALAARQAVKEADRDRGLDQFLNKLPAGNREGPKVRVEPLEINLGQLTGERRFTVRLENAGGGLLTGSVAGDGTKWLAFGDAPGTPQKFFQCRGDCELAVHVVGKNLRAGGSPVEGRIVVETNGGTATVLVRAEKPVQAFPDGALAGAKTPREIAAKAKANPKEAARLFEKGAVQAWYEANGWTYPVQGPSSSGLGAIQQFYEALGLVPAPKVALSQERLRFQGRAGASLEQLLQVQTSEKRPVYAHATTAAPWLQIGRTTSVGRTATIPVRVPSVPAMPGERLRGTIQVTSNGNQRFTVEVEMNVTGDGTEMKAATVPLLDLDAVLDVPLAGVVESVGVQKVASAAAAAAAAPSDEDVLEVVAREAPKPPSAQLQAAPPAPVPSVPAPPTPAPAPAPQGSWAWRGVHLLPVMLLLFFLSVPCVRDSFVWIKNLGATPEEGIALPEEVRPIKPDVPRVELQFHDAELQGSLGSTGLKPTGGGDGGQRTPVVWEPSMRFGIQMVADDKGESLGTAKRLTFKEQGITNNAVVRLDRSEWLFGERPFRRVDNGHLVGGDWPGRWRERDKPLGKDEAGKPRRGRQSVWVYDKEKVAVTQTVEVVAGPQSGVPDTVLIHYLLANEDDKPHQLGLRFLLDTYIGDNDGVPFLIPGKEELCTSSMVFANQRTMPDFIQAREFEDLKQPGTIAQVQLKVGGGLEAPDRVTLGAWPNMELAKRDNRCRQEKTMWEVPVLDIHTLSPGDSAVVLYWNPRQVQPGESRRVGFAYGLGNLSSREGEGKLAVTVAGDFMARGEFTVAALVTNPVKGQTVTLNLPNGFDLIEGPERQDVPMPKPEKDRPGVKPVATVPVTWKVRGASNPGTYSLKVESSTGASQRQSVKILAKGIFGGN